MMETKGNTVGQRVQRLRRERDWTARRLAAECAGAGMPSLTRGTLAKIESGVRKSVTVEELVALAQAFGVPVTELLPSEGPVSLAAAGAARSDSGQPEDDLSLSQPDIDLPGLPDASTQRQPPRDVTPAPLGTSPTVRSLGRPSQRYQPFFISYAHAGPDSNQAVERLYNELRGNLQTLVDRPVSASMGFFDKEGDGPAIRSRPELTSALGTCQVLVALISVPYLNSEWCAKEWHAFTLRVRDPQPGASLQGPIIPVRWAPIPFNLPAAIKDEVQIFKPQGTKGQPDLSRWYEEEGLFGLLRSGQEEAFRDIVWELAKYIQRIYYSQVLRPMNFTYDNLKNVFEGG
jgi:transcriptional regulator with XRE-family HTH domain